MNNITVTYKLPFIRLKKKGTVPTSWGEVSPIQLLAIHLMNLPGIDIDKCISMLLGFPKFIVKRMAKFHKYMILEGLSFMREQQYYDRFIYKEIIVHKKKYTSPKDKLKDLPFGQFILIDTFHAEYCEGGTKKQLAKFLSVLFADDYKHAYSMPFESVDKNVGDAIVFNYTLIRIWLQKRYTYLFPEARKTNTGKKKEKNYGWLDTFDNLVGDDIVNDDKYAEIPTHKVLRFLNNKIKEQRKNGSKF